MIDKNMLLNAKTQEEVIKELKEIRYYPELKEIQGDKYAIVVIPTKDINGEYARMDLEIFKGLHIIFVVNKLGTFNYAQAVNHGVEKALSYNPKWVIISNDDMYKVDDIDKLVKELKASEEYDTLFFPTSDTYSDKVVIAKPMLQKTIRYLRGGWRKEYQQIMDKLGVKYEVLDLKNRGFIYSHIIYTQKETIPHHQGSFLVINTEYIKNTLKGKVFDETFYNGHEDTFLCYKFLNNSHFKMSDFDIGNYVGKSLGTGVDRIFWELANEIYFEKVR